MRIVTWFLFGIVFRRPRELIIVRHAQSMRNEAKKGSVYFADDAVRELVRGIPDQDIGITEKGHEQARKTGEYLRDHFEPPEFVYHSGYRRTVETMNDILSAFSPRESSGIKVRMNPFIRERDPGYAYDMTREEAESAFPWLHEYWRTFGGFFARPPGGESLADVLSRVYMFVNMLFRDRCGKRVWVITHGGTIRLFRFILERWTYEQGLRWPEGGSPKNCGITVYRYSPCERRLVLVEYNTVAWE